MPLPDDDQLEPEINKLYDAVQDGAHSPGQFGFVAARAAKLQAVSQRRLVLAIDEATETQKATNRRIERLELVGIVVAAVAALLAVVQVVVAVWFRG